VVLHAKDKKRLLRLINRKRKAVKDNQLKKARTTETTIKAQAH
jgi:hypothetical protein